MLHVQQGGASSIKLEAKVLRRVLGDIHGLRCRWDLEGRYLVVLSPCPLKYDRGNAIIFCSMTGIIVHSCRINSDTSWPQWLLYPYIYSTQDGQIRHDVASCISSQLSSQSQQCFSHNPSGKLTLACGESVWEDCGSRWSRVSPDGMLITTFLAETEPKLDRFEATQRSAYAFQHCHTMTTRETSMLLVEECRRVPSHELKSHPFLCAWLPGTNIYAAAALGYVYVVDGMHDSILKAWPANAYEKGDDDDAASMKWARTRGPDFAGLSWSPDGLHLAWIHLSELRIVSFADVL